MRSSDVSSDVCASDLQASAKETMTVATEYRIGTTRSYPEMQLNVKENIQNASNGQIYVKLAPGGQLGVGTKMAEKMQSGTVQIGRAHVGSPVTHAHLVCRLLLAKNNSRKRLQT